MTGRCESVRCLFWMIMHRSWCKFSHKVEHSLVEACQWVGAASREMAHKLLASFPALSGHHHLIIQIRICWCPSKSLGSMQPNSQVIKLMMHNDINTSWIWQHSSNIIAHHLICTQRSSLTGGLEKGRRLRNHLGTIRCGKNGHFELTNYPPPVSGLTDAVNLSAKLRLSVLQVRKLQDKVSKCQEAVKKSKENYELALLDITNYNSR